MHGIDQFTTTLAAAAHRFRHGIWTGQLALQPGPLGPCHPKPRTSAEAFRAVRPQGKPDSPDQARLGGAQRSVH